MPEIELYAKVDGQPVPLRELTWVFSGPCGHPYGLLSPEWYPTVEAAWQWMWPAPAARREAQRRGDTAALARDEQVRGDDEFWRHMKDGCGCGAAAGAVA